MSVIRIKTRNLRHRENSGKIIFTVDDLEEFPEWPDSDLIELLHGELFMVPSPSTLHQRISKEIEFQIQLFLKENKIGELFHAPIDVELGEEDLVVPDIVVVLDKEKEIIKERRIKGTPSLIVEIASTNKKIDLVDKKDIYEKYKVKEYVIIEPEENFILIYRLNKKLQFEEPIKKEIPGKFKLKTLNNLEISI